MLYIAIALIIIGVAVIFLSFFRKEENGNHESTIVRKRPPEYSDDDIVGLAVHAEMDGYGEFAEHHSSPNEADPAIQTKFSVPESVDDALHLETAPVYSGPIERGIQDAVNDQVRNGHDTIPAGSVKEGIEKQKSKNTDMIKDSGDETEKGLPYDNNVYAVLFNDYSGDIEYDGSDNTIDPTFGKYSALKRVGRGTIEVIKDGINFKLLKNLYRFDFHRIHDIQGSENYVAVLLKGSDIIRLFLVENDDYCLKIIRDYKNFCRK
ncbi:MAG TPA: hypothetical protein PLI62_08165 [Spirochaetota bacterium]|nr:hypothetical protein [Spirochaetota bacterium]HQP49755.1 hypothetical protein [Spirochaetota bacterium]